MSTLRWQLEDHIRGSKPAFALAGLEPYREVAGAAGLDNILKGRINAPGCYVYRHSVRAKANVYDDGVQQVLAEKYGVVTVVRRLTDARQADSSDLAELYSEVIQMLVLSWHPSEHIDDFTYAGGQLVTLQNGFYHWQDIFNTGRIMRHA